MAVVSEEHCLSNILGCLTAEVQGDHRSSVELRDLIDPIIEAESALEDGPFGGDLLNRDLFDGRWFVVVGEHPNKADRSATGDERHDQ